MKGTPKAWDGVTDGSRSGGQSLKRRWAYGEGGGGDEVRTWIRHLSALEMLW